MYLKPEIAKEKLIKLLASKGISDTRVLDAFRKVNRHEFTDAALASQAYEDNALPIGQGQTISQPYVVALMTQLLNLGKDDKILEIGTGSGFQTAILAQFSRRIYSIERHYDLSEAACKRLRGMGFANIVFKAGDGTCGWPTHAPFDRIIVTAGAPVLPQTLCDQLTMGGRLIIPVGDKAQQSLDIYDKTESGLVKDSIAGVSFVPLIGAHGWQK